MFQKNEKKIIRWTGSPGVGKDGILLIPGQEYEAQIFGLDVAEAWVKQGSAEWMVNIEEKKEPRKKAIKEN